MDCFLGRPAFSMKYRGGGGRPHVYFGTFLPDDPRFVSGKRDNPSCDTVIVYDLDLQESIMLYVTANGCVITDEKVNNRYIEMIYRTERGDRNTKICLFHRILMSVPITGHIGDDLNVQESRRESMGALHDSAFRGASAPISARKGAGKAAIPSAPRGAGGVWRPS